MKRWFFAVAFLGMASQGLLSSCMLISQCTDKPARTAAVEASLETRLREHVTYLAVTCHPRDSSHLRQQKAVVDYIARSLRESGGQVDFQTFMAEGRPYVNVRSVIPGSQEGRIIIGAHYDACGDTPGADDNASGIAGLLEVARLLKGMHPRYTIELVAYANEEPPFFKTKHMGSAHHAALMAESKTAVHGMIALEMIGFYSDRDKSQNYPSQTLSWVYPDKGNFIAVLGNWGSVSLARQLQQSLAEQMPTVRLNAPEFTGAFGLSDHINYWEHDMPAVMITDTAFYRNVNYHQSTDTPDTLDYKRMALVVRGVAAAVRQLAR